MYSKSNSFEESYTTYNRLRNCYKIINIELEREDLFLLGFYLALKFKNDKDSLVIKNFIGIFDEFIDNFKFANKTDIFDGKNFSNKSEFSLIPQTPRIERNRDFCNNSNSINNKDDQILKNVKINDLKDDYKEIYNEMFGYDYHPKYKKNKNSNEKINNFLNDSKDVFSLFEINKIEEEQKNNYLFIDFDKNKNKFINLNKEENIYKKNYYEEFHQNDKNKKENKNEKKYNNDFDKYNINVDNNNNEKNFFNEFKENNILENRWDKDLENIRDEFYYQNNENINSSKHLIDAYRAYSDEFEIGKNITCNICQNDFNTGDLHNYHLDCNHYMHFECFKTYLENQVILDIYYYF